MKLRMIGSAETARQVVQRAAREVTAYRQVLATAGCRPDESWERLPLTDKAGYLT